MTLKKLICCQKYICVLVVVQTVVSVIAETIQISSAAISSRTKTLSTEAAETSITPTSDTMQTVAEKSGNAKTKDTKHDNEVHREDRFYTKIVKSIKNVRCYSLNVCLLD
jgi:poly-D-alanine transfer protein DltD